MKMVRICVEVLCGDHADEDEMRGLIQKALEPVDRRATATLDGVHHVHVVREAAP